MFAILASKIHKQKRDQTTNVVNSVKKVKISVLSVPKINVSILFVLLLLLDLFICKQKIIAISITSVTNTTACNTPTQLLR